MKEPLSRRERVGITASLVTGLAMIFYGGNNLLRDHHVGSQSAVPRYREECVLDLSSMEGVHSWEDVVAAGQALHLTQDDITPEELIVFNGLPADTPFDSEEAGVYIDACVDGRTHGYVGFYGDIDATMPLISDYVVTTEPVEMNPLSVTSTPTEVHVYPTVTPMPTDIVPTDPSLFVMEKQNRDESVCQYNSSYQLTMSLPQTDERVHVFNQYSCSDTLLEGGHHVTNAHCVATVKNMYDQRYGLVDPETHRNTAHFALQGPSEDHVTVVGGDFSIEHDIAVLYTVHPEGSQIRSCLKFGDETQVEKLSPVQLMNYANGATSPREYRARFLGANPDNGKEYLLADGVDPEVPADGTSRNGTVWFGASGGNVVTLDSGEYIGTTSNIRFRTIGDPLIRKLGIDPDAFVRIATIRPSSQVISLIKTPYNQPFLQIELPLGLPGISSDDGQ